jgi:two-component system sensor histidine kinase PhoQ
MDDIVHYQLQRATTAGASQSAPPLGLAVLADRLLASMAKVYADRGLALINEVSTDVLARIDEGDAMELLGNLIDNACKWANKRVVVHAQRREGGLLVAVEDDGPGVVDPEHLMLRGQRGDEGVPGHGIGLAIVHDIALAYCGELRVERSELGGARVIVWLGES